MQASFQDDILAQDGCAVNVLMLYEAQYLAFEEQVIFLIILENLDMEQ